MVRIKITHPDAAWYPFPAEFQLGDIVEHVNGDNLTQGKIIDAEYEGPPKEHRGGSYSVIYTIEQENGLCYNAKEFELKKIPPLENP
jgi:hypothetical protein